MVLLLQHSLHLDVHWLGLQLLCGCFLSGQTTLLCSYSSQGSITIALCGWHYLQNNGGLRSSHCPHKRISFWKVWLDTFAHDIDNIFNCRCPFRSLHQEGSRGSHNSETQQSQWLFFILNEPNPRELLFWLILIFFIQIPLLE